MPSLHRVRVVLAVVITVVPACASFATTAGAVAAGSTRELWVSATGADAGTCTRSNPCATVQRAVDLAGDDPATIAYLGAKGLNNATTISAGQHITIAGVAASGETEPPQLQFWGSGLNGPPMISNSGDLRIAGLELNAIGSVDIDQVGSGSLEVSGSEFTGGVLALRMSAGTATISDSAVRLNTSGGTAMTLSGGALELADTTLDEPVVQTGGHLHALHLGSGDTPHTLQISGGTAAIDSSGFFEDVDAVHVTGTASVVVDHSSFDSGGVSVDGPDADATVVASSFVDSDPTLTVSNGAMLSLAASAIDSPASCSGPVVDGGYNSATDATCAFVQPTSLTNAPQGQFHPASIDGPYNMADIVPLAGPTFQGDATTLVDRIPEGATATFDPAIALCAAGSVDQRGQTRPVVGKCDIGAIELGPSAVTLTANARKLFYGQPLTLTARAAQPSGVALKLLGHIMFSGTQTPLGSRCYNSPLRADGSARCTWRPYAYPSTFTATFVPTDALHASSARMHIDVTPDSATIRSSGPAVVTSGHSARLSATWRPDHAKLTWSPYVGLRLQARSSAHSAWHNVTRTMPTSKDGPVAATVTPEHTTSYRWTARAVSSMYRAAFGPVLTVRVVPRKVS